MDWMLFVCALIINSELCLLQGLFQFVDYKGKKLPKRHSIIPETRQKFLYWQDFYTQTYGDFIGLLWVMNSFIHLLLAGKIDFYMIIVLASVGVISVIFFLRSCLNRDHKPDWGFPKTGRISLGGLSHLPYYGLNWGMIAVCLVKTYTGELNGILLWSFLAGSIFFLFMTYLDKKAGHFDPLKTV